MIGAIGWKEGLIAAVAAVVFVMILVVGQALVGWFRLRRAKTPLPLRIYLALKMRGLAPQPIATAYWATRALKMEAPLEVWISFAMLRVDVVKLAAALAVAGRDGLATGVGQLGAAALVGFDPMEVVQEARKRGLTTFANEDLNQLEAWGLTRAGESI